MNPFADAPKEWTVGRVGMYCDVQLGKMLQNDPVSENDQLKPYLRAINVAKDRLDLSHQFSMWIRPQELDRFRLKKGDILVSEGGDSGRTVIFDSDQEHYFQNAINRLRPDSSERVDPRFLYHWFTYLKLSGYVDLICNVATISHFTAEKVKASPLIIPPIDIQRQIAQFLDSKIEKINQLIDKKLELLDRLAEKRQVLITQAVTNGSWEKWKLSHAYGNIGSGTTPTASDDRYYTESDGVLWVTTGELRERHISKTARRITDEALRRFSALRLYSPGSLLIAMYGATIGRLGIIDIEAACNQACCVFESSDQFDNRFLFYWLWHRRNDLIALSVGGGQPNLSQQDLREEKVPCPPLIVQQQIVKFLDDELAKIDALARKLNEAIALLEEYRSALITSSVTGQIPKLLEDEAV